MSDDVLGRGDVLSSEDIAALSRIDAPADSLVAALSGVPDHLEPIPEGLLVPASEHPALGIGEHRYDCPGCAASWVGRGIKRASAASFCPTCDFPLFLSVPPPAPPARSTEDAQRRLPGVDGRDQLGAASCRQCGEPNPPDPTASCLRCGSALTPPPAAPAPQVIREVVTETVVVKVPSRGWMIATALLTVLLLIMSVALWRSGWTRP